MRNIKVMVLMSVIFSIGILNVNALSCNNSETKVLSTAAKKVKVAYEVIDNSQTKTLEANGQETTYLVPNFNFAISIYNITEDIYVTITNDVNSESKDVYYSDTQEGIYTFYNDDFGVIYNYTITINSNNSSCSGEKIRTTKLAKPRYNAYSEYAYCENSSNYYCQKFTTKELNITSNEDFLKKIEVNNESNKEAQTEESHEETVKKTFLDNWKLYLIAFVLTVLIVVGIIIFIRNKQKNKGVKF